MRLCDPSFRYLKRYVTIPSVPPVPPYLQGSKGVERMKRAPLYLLALATLFGGAARAQSVSYVLVPTITPGVTKTNVELLRSDLSLGNLVAKFVAEGQPGRDATGTTLKAYVGPSTSRVNPLLDLSSIVTSGGMVMLQPVAGLDLVEVSFEIEQAPIRTAWK